MGNETGFTPDLKLFEVMACGSITQEEIEAGNWAPVFLFDQNHLSEWNKAASIVDGTSKLDWEIAIGPDPSDNTKSAVYRRSIPPEQLTLPS